MKNLDLNSGLWIVPSYFNHACASNTSQFFINDLHNTINTIILKLYELRMCIVVLPVDANKSSK